MPMSSKSDQANDERSPSNSMSGIGMPSYYLQFTCGKLSTPGDSVETDGAYLARQCLDRLSNNPGLPPRLFLLWATPSFQPYERLLAGIQAMLKAQNLAHVPLIGCSAAVCLFDGSAHERGAVLVCLASRRL